MAAKLVAAYTVFLVKKRNLWVGMDTEVLCLDEEVRLFPRGLSAKSCRALEELFRACIGIEAQLLHRILGSEYDFCGRDPVAAAVESLREEFLKRARGKEGSSDKSQT
jgi:hypothetical protein